MIIHFNIIILPQKINRANSWLALGGGWVAAGVAQPRLEPSPVVTGDASRGHCAADPSPTLGLSTAC